LTTREIYAHGKLLLTAEYAVLDGALALAVPTVFGQKFTIAQVPANEVSVIWKSYDCQGNLWLETSYPSDNIQGEEVLLHKILDYISENTAEFNKFSYHIESHLEFPRNWGLGSSSTLIYFLAKAFGQNPYQLNEIFFKGSGYDIACAGEDTPILFMKKDGKYYLRETELNFSFKENLFFAFLGKKKNSRDAINHYRNEKSTPDFIKAVTKLTNEMLLAETLANFQDCVKKHESLLSQRLQTPPIFETLFHDLNGAVKSLGGWGGDFVLIATKWDKNTLKEYLSTKNIDTVFTYSEMVFKK
jgi:mevalonate kinase